MKFIRNISTEFVENLLNTYRITIDLDPADTYSIARSVYAACEKFIPQNLIGIFTELGIKNILEEDIIQHLIFNTYMVSNINENQFVESNNSECKKTVEELKKSNLFVNTRQITNYKKILDNKVGDYFNLGKVLEDNKSFNKKNEKIEQFRVPNLAAPFIFFTVVNYDFHRDFNESNLLSSRVLVEQLNLYKIFLENKEDGQKLISNHLFEREYNIQLYLSIQKEIKRKATIRNFNDKESVYKVLTLLSLLPNIQGRVKYIKVFLMVKELLTNGVNDYGQTFGDISDCLLTEEIKELNWVEKVSEIILQLAIFTFPIMESLHYYLTTELKTNVNAEIQINNSRSIHENDIDISVLSKLSDFNTEIQSKFNEFCVEDLILRCNIEDKSTEDDETIDIIENIFYRFETIEKHVYKVIDEVKNRILINL
jgi:hypothetical protein